jgi:hypothetical protein
LYYEDKPVNLEFLGIIAIFIKIMMLISFFTLNEKRIFKYHDNPVINVYMEYKFMQILKLLPKSMKRILGIELKMIPFYRMCCDNDNKICAHDLIKKNVHNVIFVFFVVGFIFPGHLA